MGWHAPAGLLGIHTNLPATIPPEVGAAIAGGGPAPAGLFEQERALFEALRMSAKNQNLASVAMMGARPQACRLRPDGLPRDKETRYETDSSIAGCICNGG
jgi:hypothetical protein